VTKDSDEWGDVAHVQRIWSCLTRRVRHQACRGDGSDGVRRVAVLRALEGEHFGESNEGSLGRGVGRLSEDALERRC
jgi:hypothetical protein